CCVVDSGWRLCCGRRISSQASPLSSADTNERHRYCGELNVCSVFCPRFSSDSSRRRGGNHRLDFTWPEMAAKAFNPRCDRGERHLAGLSPPHPRWLVGCGYWARYGGNHLYGVDERRPHKTHGFLYSTRFTRGWRHQRGERDFGGFPWL